MISCERRLPRDDCTIIGPAFVGRCAVIGPGAPPLPPRAPGFVGGLRPREKKHALRHSWTPVSVRGCGICRDPQLNTWARGHTGSANANARGFRSKRR
ncbi:putative E3 Ubiquitin-Protein Ligase Herc1 [Manis pentadactyla]|nr:putative E3 Ubiquitin-Protein Ligase Herc1 [Manis pentadactyla]